MIDNLAECLEICGSISITDDTNANRLSWFSTTIKNNEIKIKAKDTIIKDANFYNNKFTIKINVRKKANSNMKNYYSSAKDKCIVSNFVTSNIKRSQENVSKKSNSVDVELYAKITTSATNGTITQGNSKIPMGKDIKITYQPKKGYKLKSISVNTESKDRAINNEQFNIYGIDKDYDIQVIYELILGTVKIIKRGTAGKMLQGAEFTLYAKIDIYVDTDKKYSKGDEIKKLITNENGYITFEDLYEGEYQLIETKAPDGYSLNGKEINFKVTGENESHEFTVNDTALFILPNCGEKFNILNIIYFWVLCSLIIGILIMKIKMVNKK